MTYNRQAVLHTLLHHNETDVRAMAGEALAVLQEVAVRSFLRFFFPCFRSGDIYFLNTFRSLPGECLIVY